MGRTVRRDKENKRIINRDGRVPKKLLNSKIRGPKDQRETNRRRRRNNKILDYDWDEQLNSNEEY